MVNYPTPLYPSRDTRQCCPFSLLLCALIIETLVIYLCMGAQPRSFLHEGREDLMYLSNLSEDFHFVLQTVERCAFFLSFMINWTKSVNMPLGECELRTHCRLTVVKPGSSFRYLGLLYSVRNLLS